MAAENGTHEQTSGNAAVPSANVSEAGVSAANLVNSEATPAGSNSKDERSRSDRGRRGDRGGGRGQDRGRNKRKNAGKEDRGGPVNRRERNGEFQERKRRRVNGNGTAAAEGEPEHSYMSIPFPEAEIAAEERRPKRKVAVLIGYSGTGYHGLQINHKDKTVEGDIFAALVAAKAISKANADDPRKSSFVRCARTDKGVHAAGNMISLKLIIEDPDVVKKINDALPPQIRVWGIHRTNNAFSCYQACDSRWYEYLMPSYCLLPPHPESFLGKKLPESVKEKSVEEDYAKRLGEVKDYWKEVEENDIKPILDSLEPRIRDAVIKRIHASEKAVAAQEESTGPNGVGDASGEKTEDKLGDTMMMKASDDVAEKPPSATAKATQPTTSATAGEDSTVAADLASAPGEPEGTTSSEEGKADAEPKPKELSPVEAALRQIKTAYVAAKRRYRASPERIAQLQQALDQYVGTRNFHNYTIQKAHDDPSAKRTIKSFVADPQPIQINDTQWLSLKVHGQSFMMHQIRKMVGMAVLATRCGAPLSVVSESYGPARISIPKAPGLGLLLERPVFDNYNRRAVDNLGLEPLDFGNYERQIREFKDHYIYRHIFELEEKENSFHSFFHQIDNFKSDYFLWATAGGIDAAQKRVGMQGVPKELEDELGNDGEDPEEGDG
ncbi:hypothetical protein DL764_000005 [Monosporascus ibericus]|uniref:tRNA pseudouridine synthase 1 n=1 Tax=Monosporascus ibericus TaxID=155417 RepID=A0A4Q4TWX5_9PEZI|nr:hypothetical protein DL764_000005 [Monosporascus ibericus]